MEMKAADHFLYEYAVIRYVPRVDREEFINIGLLMICKRQKWLKGKIEIDSSRLLAFDPKANLESIIKQAAMFENTNLPDASLPAEEKYRWLSAVKSSILQTSPSHPGIIINGESADSKETLKFEFNRLFADLVSL